MTKERWKDIFISVLVGAVVAFITAFLEGTLEALNNLENNAVGGVTSTLYYISKHLT